MACAGGMPLSPLAWKLYTQVGPMWDMASPGKTLQWLSGQSDDQVARCMPGNHPPKTGGQNKKHPSSDKLILVGVRDCLSARFGILPNI